MLIVTEAFCWQDSKYEEERERERERQREGGGGREKERQNIDIDHRYSNLGLYDPSDLAVWPLVTSEVGSV